MVDKLNGHVISDDNKIAGYFKNLFENTVKELNTDMDPNILSISNHDDMILYNREKFKNHPSIKRIKDVTNLDGTFTFNFITLDNMVNKMNHLDLTKSNPLTSIPTKKLLKLYVHPHLDYGNVIYHNQRADLMQLIEQVQYKSALIVSGCW